MNKQSWLLGVLLTTIFLLGTLNHQRVTTLHPFIKMEKAIKLSNFNLAKQGLKGQDEELLELWESLLTGRAAPLARWMKERYQELGLKHLFTPSGFHLSAVLAPFFKLTRSLRIELLLLSMVGMGLLFLSGQWALKRMVLIKAAQRILGQKTGFLSALVLDLLLGSFQHSPLSFSYSFLFLGIIYSGLKGAGSIWWLYLAQVLLAYFQGNLVSPLLLIFSPILNLAFGLAMPFLFVLAIPLWSWQLQLGLSILRALQSLVNAAAACLQYIPLWEVHLGVVIFFGLFLFRKWRPALLLMAVLSNSLNLDLQKQPGPKTYEFVPRGEIIKIKERIDESVVYFEDGRCKRKLVRGMWWERCFPKRRSTRKKS